MSATSPLNIIVWGINYWPEVTGIAPFNRGLCRFLAAQGHVVRMVSAFAYYPAWKKQEADRRRIFHREMIDGISVYRCWQYVPQRVTTAGRFLHEFSFCLLSFLRVLALPRADVYFIASPPLMLGLFGWLASFLKRGRFVFHVQDLQPDAALALGMLKQGLLARVLHAMAMFAYRKAHLVSGISRAMIASIAEKGVRPEKLYLFPNWVEAPSDSVAAAPRRYGAAARTAAPELVLAAAEGEAHSGSGAATAGNFALFETSRPPLERDPKELRWRKRHGIPANAFLASYAGNLGRKQGLEILIDVAEELDRIRSSSSAQVHIIIAGDGAARPEIEARWRAGRPANVQLLPLLPAEDYAMLLATSDISLIPQVAGTGRFCFPSKLLSVLLASCPVVALTEETSELARVVREGEFGVVVPPDDPRAIAHALHGLTERLGELENFSREADEWIRQYDARLVLTSFERTLLHTSRAKVPGAGRDRG